MTLEQAIDQYLAQGHTRGRTATPAGKDYARASALDFRRCECSARHPPLCQCPAGGVPWTMVEHIARGPRGGYLSLGTNPEHVVSLGSNTGYHSAMYRRWHGPPCV